MKRKFWIAPFAALAVVFALVLSACGGPSVEELIREDLDTALSAVNPEDEDLLEAMESGSDGAFDELGIDMKEFAKAYLDGYKYEIGNVTVDEDAGKASASVTVNMKSLTAIMTDFADQFEAWMYENAATVSSEEEAYKKAGEMLMEIVQAAEPKETDVTFNYEKDDEGTWISSEGAENAILSAMM